MIKKLFFATALLATVAFAQAAEPEIMEMDRLL